MFGGVNSVRMFLLRIVFAGFMLGLLGSLKMSFSQSTFWVKMEVGMFFFKVNLCAILAWFDLPSEVILKRFAVFKQICDYKLLFGK